jgi:molybdopterin-guanine dinucleotide biosynthesis adapter protein
MLQIVGVVGRSGVGKSTLAVKIIKELKSRGHKVGAVKHTTHKIDIDQPGKDSNLMHDAGACAVAISSKDKTAMYMDTESEWSPAEIAVRLFPEVDIVVVEGFGGSPMPRIAVLRKGACEELHVKKGLIGIVADFDVDTDIPVFTFDQVPDITDLFENYIKTKGPKRDAYLFVNGEKIFIKPFIKDFFLKTISAMVDTLKGTGDAKRIEILIDRPSGGTDQK